MTDGETSQRGRYGLVRTLRIRTENVPGVLGAWASAIGTAGANIGNVETVQIGHRYVLRDVDLLVNDEDHLERTLRALSQIKAVTVLESRDEVLDVHRGGKIAMVSRLPVTSLDHLRKIYTPGVADVCLRIREDPSLHELYTSIPNMVAIVTDGTAVLGLGNIGPLASMPVMEGKAELLNELVGLSGIPILLDTTDPDEIVEAVKHIAITFGAIQLEDIAAPRCFEISRRLSQELPIPVMHDDQHGTAVVVLASVLRAASICGLDLSKATIGQIGLGAAGMGIVEILQRQTGNPVLGADIADERLRRLESTGGIASTLEEIMAKADIVIATTGVKNLIPPDSVRRGQVIFALSNPEPEITPAVALERGAALAGDGRSVNNLLGFPGIWKGALDSRATKITMDMLVDAAMALAGIAKPGEILPFVLDKNVHIVVAQAVAAAAMRTGIARKTLDEDYFEAPGGMSPSA